MAASYVVTGVQTDEHTLRLDQNLPLMNQRLRIVVEPEGVSQSKRPYAEVMADIRRSQEARGHVPMTREQIDAYIEAERASWDD